MRFGNILCRVEPKVTDWCWESFGLHFRREEKNKFHPETFFAWINSNEHKTSKTRSKIFHTDGERKLLKSRQCPLYLFVAAVRSERPLRDCERPFGPRSQPRRRHLAAANLCRKSETEGKGGPIS